MTTGSIDIRERYRAARCRAVAEMCTAVVAEDHTGRQLDARQFLREHAGLSADETSTFMICLAKAYDLEMCAEWSALFNPEPIRAPKPRWKRWRDVLLEEAFIVFAAMGMVSALIWLMKVFG